MEFGFTKEQIIKLIKNDRLYFVVFETSTQRVLKGYWAVIKSNKLKRVSPNLKCKALGTSRTFELYLELLDMWKIKHNTINWPHYYVLGFEN